MVRRRPALLGLAALAAGLLVPLAPAGAGTADDAVPRFDRVFLIVGENTSLSQLDSNDAPYQLGTLKPRSAWFSDYWGISHYSTSNYIAMTWGKFTACDQADEKPATCHHPGTDNLFSEMNAAGVGWKAWNESMPGSCWLVNSGKSADQNSYRPKHNPAAYFDDIVGVTSGTQGTGASCLANDVSMSVDAAHAATPNDTGAFDAALQSGSVPRFNMIVPNMCEDGHDNCAPTGNPIRQFDGFLAREIPNIMRSSAWTPGSVIVVVYDEGQDGGPGKAVKFAGGNVPFLVLGGSVHAATYSQTANHYSLLRTLEDGLGIPTHANNAATASTLGDIWN
ncbi:MAG TPA: alkaline phosphatase family protein [Candidatus Nanopelagicales bacterium]|nr:alkaline phosphatase family protein [Candidatus Nanopelagicales bacterium]